MLDFQDELKLSETKITWEILENNCFMCKEINQSEDIILIAFYHKGKLTDYNGVAAWRQWADNGVLIVEEFYKNGKLQDPDKDTPAVKKWDYDGRLVHLKHYRSEA